jgi:hypothetical protein
MEQDHTHEVLTMLKPTISAQEILDILLLIKSKDEHMNNYIPLEREYRAFPLFSHFSTMNMDYFRSQK